MSEVPDGCPVKDVCRVIDRFKYGSNLPKSLKVKIVIGMSRTMSQSKEQGNSCRAGKRCLALSSNVRTMLANNP